MVKENASKLHRDVFDVVSKRFKFFTIFQEYPFKQIDAGGKEHVLYIDIYVREINLAIECHGEQHFKANSHFHKTSGSFELAQKNDRLKEEWCCSNGIKLVTFLYNEKLDEKYINKKIDKILRS